MRAFEEVEELLRHERVDHVQHEDRDAAPAEDIGAAQQQERGEPEEVTLLRDLRLEEERLRRETARVQKRAREEPGSAEGVERSTRGNLAREIPDDVLAAARHVMGDVAGGAGHGLEPGDLRRGQPSVGSSA
mgnify:CR=1 FL=1